MADGVQQTQEFELVTDADGNEFYQSSTIESGRKIISRFDTNTLKLVSREVQVLFENLTGLEDMSQEFQSAWGCWASVDASIHGKKRTNVWTDIWRQSSCNLP